MTRLVILPLQNVPELGFNLVHFFSLTHTQTIFFLLSNHYFPLSQNQAKLFIEQKKIPFPVDNHNTNEELGEFAFTSKYKPDVWQTDLNLELVVYRIICLCSYRLRSDRQRPLRRSHQTLLTLTTGVCVCFSQNILSQRASQDCSLNVWCVWYRVTRSSSVPFTGEG